MNFGSEKTQGTEVSGTILPPGETWSPTGNPYIVVGDVIVTSGATLTIEPGVQVKFDGYYGIYIDGTLIAIGTENDRINITSNMTSPVPHDWHRIQIYSNGFADIEYCDISNAYYGIYFNSSSNNVIANNNILKNTHSIYLHSSSNNTIMNNNIASNNWGVYLWHSSNNTIMNNSISNNNRGIFFSDSNPNSTVTNNSILGNAGFGIYSEENAIAQFNYWGATDLTKIERMVYNVDYSNPLITDPTGMDLQFIGDAVWSGTIYIDNGTIINGNVKVTEATIVFNHSKGQNFIQVNGKMIVENSILKSNHGLYTVLYTNNSMGYVKNSTIIEQRAISLEADGLNVSGNELSQGRYGVYCVNGASKNYIANNEFLDNNFNIEFYLSSNNIATNNTITNGVYGVEGGRSSYNIITKNKIFSNGTSQTFDIGIHFSSSSNNKIADNIIYSNELAGISFSSSSNSTIVNNIIYSNNENGIAFYSSSHNLITNNNISSNDNYGIYLLGSDMNNIIHNDVISNGIYGIYLLGSDMNNITHNDVSSNIGYGTFLIDSLSNSLYHNNFIDNTFQAFDNTNYGNQWDNGYPSGGNYWSDHDEPSEGAYDDYWGSDQDVLGSDGIVDQGPPVGGKNPYVTGFNSQDNYPLMYPFDDLIFLYEGWNLISIPFIQLDQDLNKVLENIDGDYSAVQWFDVTDPNDPWKHYKVGKPFGNDLSEINETMGFWIKITAPVAVVFEYFGIPPTQNQTISLHPGWNLVGYPSLTSYNRTNGLNNITFEDDVDFIQWYDAATKTWHTMNENDYFVPGRGYWFHVKTECVWEVPL
ncbi:MAG: right-handed parallel beta-helix repeat-containing protein [Methanomassiliicoccales archaeon]|nr:MAG: right-handed parallel beta-helix repeat-containing protein [Methanomassiliicoccales archaeon]